MAQCRRKWKEVQMIKVPGFLNVTNKAQESLNHDIIICVTFDSPWEEHGDWDVTNIFCPNSPIAPLYQVQRSEMWPRVRFTSSCELTSQICSKECPLSATEAQYITGTKRQPKNQSQNLAFSDLGRGRPAAIKISTPLTTLEVRLWETIGCVDLSASTTWRFAAGGWASHLSHPQTANSALTRFLFVRKVPALSFYGLYFINPLSSVAKGKWPFLCGSQPTFLHRHLFH